MRTKTDPVRASVRSVISCLTEQFHEGSGYNSLNTLRSALSAVDRRNDSRITSPRQEIYDRGV